MKLTVTEFPFCSFLSCSISDAVDELKKSSRHGKYLENISYSQVHLTLYLRDIILKFLYTAVANFVKEWHPAIKIGHAK